MMAAIGLAVGEIEDVAEDAADRRAHRVQDTKRPAIDNGHDQNQRVATGVHAACERRRANMTRVRAATRRIDRGSCEKFTAD